MLKYCIITVHDMSWQPVPDINVDKSFQTAVTITVILVKSKIMTTRVNRLTINDIEQAITININKAPNNRKHRG